MLKWLETILPQLNPDHMFTAPIDITHHAVPVSIPYDYRPPVQGPRSYARPVVTIGKGEGQPMALGNSVPRSMHLTMVMQFLSCLLKHRSE